MKKLNELINCDYSVEIKGIKTNSKEVENGDLFICIKGANIDRHDFIDEAIENGAVALITDRDVSVNIPYVKVESPDEQLKNVCEKFYDDPSSKLKIIGITGTDGKTSTSTIVQTLIGSDLCGYIGTTGISCKKFNKSTTNTTLPYNKLLENFRDFIDAGCKYVVMEVSSEAIYYNRVDRLNFDVAALTTVTSDHLNTHKTLENYVNCKKQLFKQVKNTGFSILNKESNYYNEFYDIANGKKLSYGKDTLGDLIIKSYELFKDKTNISILYKDKEYNFTSPMVGDFNVYNLSCAILVCLSLGFDMEYLLNNVKNISVDGRVNIVKYNNNSIVIDYAHTLDAMEKVIHTFKKINHNKLYIVFGCTGDRDRTKRPLMLDLALRNSDYVIVTSDDLHDEEFSHIVNDMEEGITLNNYEVCKNRALAIEKAIDMLESDDILLVLGKGHEKFIIVKDKKIPFNDRSHVEHVIKERIKL